MEVLMSQYSPDDKRIAFMARWPRQPWKIYWVSSDGGTIHAISSKVVNQADPNWSLDSQGCITHWFRAKGVPWKPQAIAIKIRIVTAFGYAGSIGTADNVSYTFTMVISFPSLAQQRSMSGSSSAVRRASSDFQ